MSDPKIEGPAPAEVIPSASKSDSSAKLQLKFVPRVIKWVNDRFDRGCQHCLNQFPRRMGNLRQYSPRPITHQPPDLAESWGKYPSISVVTPTFNQANFIERTIRSVMDQAYPRLSYAVYDGKSTDGTMGVVGPLSEEYRFAWKSEPDKGQADAINKAFDLVDGEIMAWLNSDDLLMQRTLLYVGSYFEQHPDVDVIYGHRILINENDQEIGRWVTPPYREEALTYFDYVPQETLFWRRRIWDKIGGNLNVDFHFALDWDLLQRFRNAGAKIVRVPRFLGCFRVHAEQKTSAKMVDVGRTEMSWLRPDFGSDPEKRRKMTRLYYSEQFRSQLSRFLMMGGVRREWL